MGEAKPREGPQYIEDITDSDVNEDVRDLLINYSNIPADQVTQHLKDIRERAWAVFPYGCLGSFRFARFTINSYPIYPEVLERVRNGEKLLDLGCAVGQELRRLAYDGAPTENLYGVDLRLDFVHIGYDLFNDKDKLKATFIEANVFDEESSLKQLNGKISIVFIGSFLHLFDYNGQLAVAKRIVSLFDKSRDNIIIGRQSGNQNPGEYPGPARAGEIGTKFGHNPESFQEMWDKVGEATNTKWDVQAKFLPRDPTDNIARGPRGEGRGRIAFVVKRVS